MPRIELDGPPLGDLDRKRELIRTVTAAAVQAYGLPAGSMVVVIRENDPRNVGVGGELVFDRQQGK